MGAGTLRTGTGTSAAPAALPAIKTTRRTHATGRSHIARSRGDRRMTATEVKGYGRQKGHTEIYRGAEYAVSLLPKIKIEVAVASELVDKTIEAITAAARTGHIGDGKIFVLGVAAAMRIRTGETDDAA